MTSKTLSLDPVVLESKILKAIFKRNNSILETLDTIDSRYFTIAEYASVYTAMVELYKKDSDINYETVILWLEQNGYEVDINIIKKLYNESYTSIKIKETTKALKELYIRRTILQNMREILDKQEQSPTSTEEIVEEINNIAMGSNELVSTENKNTKCCEDINKKICEIYLKLEGKQEEKGIPVGINTIDKDLNGLMAGKLWVVVADSQVGKSQMAIQLAVQACVSNPEIYVDYYSLEMTKDEVENRALAVLTGIEPRCIENPKRYFTSYDEKSGEIKNLYEENKNSMIVKNYIEKIKEGLEKLNSFNFYVDDTPDLDTLGLEARIKKNNLKRGRTDLIIIDHVGIATSGTPAEVVGKMDELYNKAKQIAKKLNCTVICLHQFSKELKNDPLHKPNVFALRGSSAPLHYADVIMGIWRPSVYTDVMDSHPELKDVCELSWQKVRYTSKPDITPMSYNGFMFKEKATSETQKVVIEEIILDENGEIIV